MTFTQPWTCPTCERKVATPFCPACGERPLAPRDLTLRGLLGQLLRVFSSVDGRGLRSVRALLLRPGALTLAFVRGERKPYLGPFQIFVLANLLFFALQTLTHSNVFSSSLDVHLHRQPWSHPAERWVVQRLAATHRTLADYAPTFDRAVVPRAKSLLIFMVVPFALLLPLLFRRARRPFVTHAVFAVHFYAFLLLVFCVAVGAAGIDLLLGGDGLKSDGFDRILTIVNLAAWAVYLFRATSVVYGAKGVGRVLQVLVLTSAVAGIALGYRLAIFLLTLYGT